MVTTLLIVAVFFHEQGIAPDAATPSQKDTNDPNLMRGMPCDEGEEQHYFFPKPIWQFYCHAVSM